MVCKDIRLASPLTYDSIVDGPGIRMVLWTQGCPHRCPGCHNPQTHDTQGGMIVSVDSIIQNIKDAQLQSGLTLSGGEPFDQVESLVPIVQAAKECGLNIWAYTGYTYDTLQKDLSKAKLLELLDVLVDGRFIEAEKDYRLCFKGSKNQRIINVPMSLQTQELVLSEYDDVNHF